MERECANPNCKCCFSPDKHNPNQRFCDREECKRYRDALRQGRYYERHSQDPEWAREHSERKRRERTRRLETQRWHRNTEKLDRQNAALRKMLTQLVAGVVSMVSGAGEHADVESIIHCCLRKGGEMYPEGIAL